MFMGSKTAYHQEEVSSSQLDLQVHNAFTFIIQENYFLDICQTGPNIYVARPGRVNTMLKEKN